MDQPPVAPPTMTGNPGPESDTSKLLAVLGYIFGIVALVAILIDPYKNEKFVRLHAVQALALWAIGIVAQFLWVIPIIGWIAGAVIGIGVLVLGIMGIINSAQGKYWEMPMVYGFVSQYI